MEPYREGEESTWFQRDADLCVRLPHFVVGFRDKTFDEECH